MNESGTLPCTHGGHGVRVVLDWEYHRVAHTAIAQLETLLTPYPRAAAFYALLGQDPQVLALWDLTDYMTVEKLGYNDHGQMHAQVVAATALHLLHLLTQGGVLPDVIASTAGTLEDAMIVVLGAALLHDVGNQIARVGHESYSVLLAHPVLARLLPTVYPDPTQAQIMMGFVLSAIASHDGAPAPSTVEGGVVAVADAADMTRGRGQVVFDRGQADIHALSAMAIREVRLTAGQGHAADIEVLMDNPAGLFQVETLLGRKLMISGLARHISLQARIVAGAREQPLLFDRLLFDQGRFHVEGAAGPMRASGLVDPVCGMPVVEKQATGSVIYQGVRYFLCSTACLARFWDNPAAYIAAPAL